MKLIKIRYLFILIFFQLPAQSITVCLECKIQNISDAIEFSKPFDTIFFKNEIFYEKDLVINKPLTLIGNKTVVDVNFLGGGFYVKSNNVNISGFIINNIKSSYIKDIAAIQTYNVSNFSFSNNEFNMPFFAILIKKSSKGIINNNTINGNAIDEISSGNGIHLWHTDNVIIEKNKISKMRDGVYLEFVNNAIIKNNLSIKNKRYGLHFMFSNNNIFEKNFFESNGVGVAVMFSKNITMNSNYFMKNWGMASYGLLLKEIYDAEIYANIFQENTISINTEGSSRLNYFNNTFLENGWAVKIAGGCYNNHFRENDFIRNTFDVSTRGTQNDNNFESNHWSNYAGYDLNKDGIGDVPYRPMKLFSYIVNTIPEAIILQRSLFIDLLNFSEKVSPIFTPKDVIDKTPLINKINYDIN